MRLTYKSGGKPIVYEFPPENVDGIEVEVFEEHGTTHVDVNFVLDGDHVPMLGGTDEEGEPVPSWADLGIQRVDE